MNPAKESTRKMITEEELADIQSKSFEDGVNFAWKMAQRLLTMDEYRLEEIFPDFDLGDDVVINCGPNDAAKRLAAFDAKEEKLEAADKCYNDFVKYVENDVREYLNEMNALGLKVTGITVNYLPHGDLSIERFYEQ